MPIGGTALYEGSLEVRVDLVKVWGSWLGLATFLDAGDVALQLSDLETAEPHLAAGAGLRFNTLVGPLRFDVGYRLNRHGAGEPDPGERFAFHLSLGQAF